MNADTQSPHLDLGDLIAEANGISIGDAARGHLAGCEQCRLEANRWNLVADGVRGLAAAAQEAPAPEGAAPAQPGLPAMPGRAAWPTGPQRPRWRVLAGPARGALLVVGSAAAALVLLIGVGAATGLVHVHLSGGSSSETVLTAVSGCAALESASGTLEQANSSSLVIKTASGQPVTVTTTAATEVGETGALLGDITDGASVTVWGLSSDGAIAAFSVIIANPAQQHPQPPPGMVVVKGTVADASTSGFTVVTSGASRVPVTTSGDTAVSVLNASLGQLPAGASILAIGSAGPDGTLSAVGVVAILQLPPGGPQLHAQAQVHTSSRVHVKNCSPAAVDEALAAGP
jgi:hypothetical protein